MVLIIILFAFGMSLVINFIEKMTGRQEEDSSAKNGNETTGAVINES